MIKIFIHLIIGKVKKMIYLIEKNYIHKKIILQPYIMIKYNHLTMISNINYSDKIYYKLIFFLNVKLYIIYLMNNQHKI